MRRARRGLKARAQTDQELDVQPRHHQVQQGPYHALVFLLVHGFSLLILIQGRHGRHAFKLTYLR